MFIGEMGCWLVVGIFSLYQRFVVRHKDASRADYHIIQPADNDVRDPDSESLRSNVPLNPAVKVLVRDEEGRLELQGRAITLLALPAICDICGTTLMNVGLLFVVPSVYQMTRGMLVIWVGIFSVVFLKKRLYLYQWFALVTVVVGVSLVGLAGAIYSEDGPKAASALAVAKNAAAIIVRATKSPDTLRAIVGVLLIAGAQVFTATQFVLEEFILEKYALEPLKVVGWEGIFGFVVTILAMIVLHLAVGRTAAGQYGYFDAIEGWREITSYRSIGVSSVLIMISIG
jgi:drug/metabolite transporter (DMT)-like permease